MFSSDTLVRGELIIVTQLRIALAIFLCSVLIAPPSLVFAASGKALSAFTFEVTPGVGTNLPYDIWGTPGTMDVLSLRTAYAASPGGNIELGMLYQMAADDKAYTIDLGYRMDIPTDAFLAFFNIGYHVSKFELSVDYDDNGDCVPTNCLTDSGYHHGLNFGGGVFIPVSASRVIRLGMKFHKKPITWLLIEAGVGFRF